MPGFKLSGRAENDLAQVYIYSFEKFGEAQADAYSLDMSACIQLLSEQPRLGMDSLEKQRTGALSFIAAT